ncbi:palmitoyltransferase ZDHHC1 isoform X8 [Lagenorhynchus albirostris]|uniref:palmitoyltransferase ZDHHC1 isoform X8 n=1 Tax=Lagenorhynchus albirostris TaxID=27610 RepID=UPI0028E4BDC9|nr:palmitoyltransferase ZDHHC1 isoform X8 [Lagenorhynchus albirostris]
MYKMNICNKPSNKTAPEKNVWTAPAQASGPSPELQGQRSRRNGWSWPPHPLQIVAWLLYLFFAVIGFGVLVPLLPHHWVPAGYACMGAIFAGHLVVHLTAVSIDPADANVRDKSYAGPLPIFNRSQHAHVIEDLHCNLCDVDVRGWVTRSRRGTGNPPARPGSKRREKPATVLCPLPTAGVLVPSTAAPATNACAASTTTASGSTTAWARGTTGSFYTVWHLPYWASCSSCWWPLMSLWSSLSTPCSCVPTATLKCGTSSPPMNTSCSIVRPRRQRGPTGSLSHVPPGCGPFSSSRFLATRGHVEPPPPSSPETLALPPRIRPQKKRKRRMYKVRTSRTLDREAPLPRLPGPRTPGRRSSSSSDSADASPAGAYHSASAESMDEIPVAQTRLGSAGLALQARAPAVFVSPSSGDPGARGGPEAGPA